MAENIFDGLQDTTFDVVTTTMGYDATWSPSAGGPTKTGRVLFNNPTESKKISEVEYDPYAYRMEYKKGVFNGLKQSADSNGTEIVTIKGQQYYVRQVAAKHDGNTLIAVLEIKTT